MKYQKKASVEEKNYLQHESCYKIPIQLKLEYVILVLPSKWAVVLQVVAQGSNPKALSASGYKSTW